MYPQTSLEIRNILEEMCESVGNKIIIYLDQERLDQDDFIFYQTSTRILRIGVRLLRSLQEGLLYLTVIVRHGRIHRVFSSPNFAKARKLSQRYL